MAWHETEAGRAYVASYREKNEAALKAAAKERYRANPDRVRQNTLARKRRDPLAFLLSQARSKNLKRGVIFTLTTKDFPGGIPRYCPVLGIPLNPFAPKGHHSLPSLDRLVPEVGYVPGNVCIISWRANLLKRDVMDPEELRKVANYLDMFLA